MNGDRLNRPVATVLGAAGVHVSGEACSSLSEVLAAGIRSLGTPPLALIELAAAIQVGAVEYERQRHRDLAAAAAEFAGNPGEISSLLALAAAPLPLQENEIGTDDAAEYLGISVQRIRQLCQAGRIRARRGAYSAWILRDDSVREYKKTRRPRGDGDNGRNGHGKPGRSAA